MKIGELKTNSRRNRTGEKKEGAKTKRKKKRRGGSGGAGRNEDLKLSRFIPLSNL
jgi:hypothetical protein